MAPLHMRPLHWSPEGLPSFVQQFYEDDRVYIIAPVCRKVLCPESRNQLRCSCAIRCGTRTDKESRRHTMRIHGQMYLGVEPPFVRPIA